MTNSGVKGLHKRNYEKSAIRRAPETDDAYECLHRGTFWCNISVFQFGSSDYAKAMSLISATFYYMAAASIASALLAVTRKNPVHSMLWVLALFLHVAGIFLLLGAEFLAAVQVIVYAGAILIFYLFVVMLLDLPDEEAHARFGRHWPVAAAVGLGFLALVWLARTGTGLAPALIPAAPYGAPKRGLAAIGMALFGPFALPFEMASLLLLAAIIGTVVLARRRGAGS
jgi:NADH-quinone oxidoreductase subunit J